MTVIIGNTNVYSTPGHGSGCPDGHQEAFRFPALATDTLGSLSFRIGGALWNTTLKLMIYADSAGAPGALLGSADVVSGLAINSWAYAPGLSVPLVEGEYYHLVILPPYQDGDSGLQYFWHTPDGDLTVPFHYSDADTLTVPSDPFGSGTEELEFPSVGFFGDTEGAGGGGGGGGAVSTEPLELTFTLCNLDGEKLDDLTALSDGDGFTVTLDEARIGTCTISVDDPIAVPPREARHVIRVVYGDTIGINGIIGSYRVRGSTGRMAIPLRDSWLRLERRELRFGHSSVDDGFTRDGRGIQQIVDDIEPSPGGAHPNGIVFPGLNDTDDDSHITHATRGRSPADVIKDYTTKEGGGDVELIPVDETHPPTSRGWEVGDLVELAVWQFQGVDRTDPTSSDFLSFDYPGNLQDFEAGPDFEAMCNYAVIVANGGEIDPDDTTYRRLATAASWAFDGILERWEPIDVGDQATSESLAAYETRVRELLLARARYLVAQYGKAPAVIELVLPADRDGTPAWGRDYGVGDRVHVDLERGWWSYVGDVRIMSVQVSRFGASGFAQQILQVTPVGAGDPVDDTETGG